MATTLPIAIFSGYNKGSKKMAKRKHKRKSHKKPSTAQKANWARMGRAAKKCSVKSTKKARRACMKRELKK